MARCAYCQAETELYHGTSPICVQCADLSPEELAARARLMHDLHESTMRAEAATEAFTAIIDDTPGAIPNPDGTERIRKVSGEVKAARDAMMKAHTRLNDFLARGIVPDDLKRSG